MLKKDCFNTMKEIDVKDKFGDSEYKSMKIILDIDSLDKLVGELHSAESKNNIKAQVIALIIQDRLQKYYQNNFVLDYDKYVSEIRKYFVE